MSRQRHLYLWIKHHQIRRADEARELRYVIHAIKSYTKPSDFGLGLFRFLNGVTNALYRSEVVLRKHGIVVHK